MFGLVQPWERMIMARRSATLQERLRPNRPLGMFRGLGVLVVATLVVIASSLDRLSAKLGGPVPVRAVPAAVVARADSFDEELRALCAAYAAVKLGVGSYDDWARANRAILVMQ